jgi:hypothetical protein
LETAYARFFRFLAGFLGACALAIFFRPASNADSLSSHSSSRAAFKAMFVATDESFVGFCNGAFAAKGCEVAGPHGLTEPVSHEPRRLVSDLHDAMELVSRDALFRAAKQVGGL